MAKKILIVDDEPSTLKLFSLIIAKLGYTVIEANNGKTGLEALKLNPEIVFIFCDYRMPEMDGKTFINHVFKNKDFKGIPIVLISAQVTFKEVGYLLERGVKGFLEKPIAANDIKNVLEQFLIPAVSPD